MFIQQFQIEDTRQQATVITIQSSSRSKRSPVQSLRSVQVFKTARFQSFHRFAPLQSFLSFKAFYRCASFAGLRQFKSSKVQAFKDGFEWELARFGNSRNVERSVNRALTPRNSQAQLRIQGHKKRSYSDPEIGQIKILRLYFVYDVTTVINPLIHQGQLAGAIIQGLGFALYEEMAIEQGRVTVSHLGDYKFFCGRDIPPLVTSLVQSTVGPGSFSAKAVAEAGISVVAPAIANAVYDATGVRIAQLPITSEKLIKGLTSSGWRRKSTSIHRWTRGWCCRSKSTVERFSRPKVGLLDEKSFVCLTGLFSF